MKALNELAAEHVEVKCDYILILDCWRWQQWFFPVASLELSIARQNPQKAKWPVSSLFVATDFKASFPHG
jgi:hypothetical protein